MLSRINRKNTTAVKSILKKLLESYKNYRQTLEFHGNISQSSVVPVLLNKFDTNPSDEPDLGAQHDFYLSYNHQNMLTVKEWIHFRFTRLKKHSKWAD